VIQQAVGAEVAHGVSIVQQAPSLQLDAEAAPQEDVVEAAPQQVGAIEAHEPLRPATPLPVTTPLPATPLPAQTTPTARPTTAAAQAEEEEEESSDEDEVLSLISPILKCLNVQLLI
jgi:hypothetical protein